MNSGLYIVKIGHTRIVPKRNSFWHSMYMFYIDLDELEKINKSFWLWGHNKWNVHSFFDKDHFTFTDLEDETAKTISLENIDFDASKYQNKNTKERIKTLVKELGLDFELDKVYLLTSLRNFGYVFNPVSFYYCFDKEGRFRALFSEVNNTHLQQKMYYYINDDFAKKFFQTKQAKNYYISPFIDYDTTLHWSFELPEEKLLMNIKSEKDNVVYLSATMIGQRKELSNWNLIYILLRYPLVTVMVIGKIHYQALKLYFKKIKFYKKDAMDQRIVKAINNKIKK